ncbi:opticin precursor [Danio rerio]|uniref:Opticin n=1 Tax=Danio rerio TaxID=7955 RepID=Q15JE7_DANRE|nr:opticin precursor [Danio rerio]ABB53599.1 opticin [Danio rerio]|eukprot:NP_001003583.2 opticin precursor [Danio rerio]
MVIQRQTSKMLLYLVWILLGFSLGAPPTDLDLEAFGLENYDDPDSWDLHYNYDDEHEEVETVAPPTALTPPPAVVVPENYVEEMTLPPRPTKSPVPSTLDFKAPGLFGPDTGLGMPTCLLCVCISGSVYCDDSDLTHIPPLPKETTHFYARFNKITEIKAADFINLNQLKRIDLSGNQIGKVNEDAFRSLLQLQDLMMADNNIQALPELPASLKHIDIRNNKLRSSGMHAEAFKEMKELQFLYLSHNKLDYIPVPLPESLRVLHLQNNNIQSITQDTFCNSHDKNYIRKALEDIRLDGNPVDINLYPQAYFCLPRLPVGTPV